MSGRGSLLKDWQSQASSQQDSGVDSRGAPTPITATAESSSGRSGDEKKVAPSTAASTSSSSGNPQRGRGRAAILHMLKELSITSETQSTISTSSSGDAVPSSSGTSGARRGGGRAKLLEQLYKDTQEMSSIGPSSSITPSVTSEKPTSSSSTPQASAFPSRFQREDEAANAEAAFFVPNNKQGQAGKSVRLSCNYIQLRSDNNKGVFMYEVQFEPRVDMHGLRRKYLNEHRDKYGGVDVFDGTILYLPIKLRDKVTVYTSKSVADQSDVKMKVIFKKQQPLKHCMTLYNVLFDRVMKTLNYVRFDRKQFDPSEPKIIPKYKLEVWPGYITAVDEFDGGIMLCCNVSHRLLCQTSVKEYLTQIYRSDPSDVGQFQDNAKKALLGCVILTRYNNLTYRIDDICFDQSPLSTFETSKGPVSYAEYYLKNYNIQIQDLNQPLLLSVKKKKAQNQEKEIFFCLVPELCFLTGLRDEMRNDYRVMREIATFTRITPNQRIEALHKLCDNIRNNKEAREILQNWGLELNNANEVFMGREFEEECIQFANTSVGATRGADFNRAATSNKPLEIKHLREWVLIHTKQDMRRAKSFCDTFNMVTRQMGMQVSQPHIVVLQSDRIDAFVNGIRTNVSHTTNAVVTISPTNRDDRYAAIKKVLCTELPIPSQNINSNTLANEAKNRSIIQKIALQINCKLGGTLWTVRIPLKGVMVCGIDSYHDPKQKGNSVAGFVASLNSDYTKWHSKAVIQSRKEELVGGLCAALVKSIIAYQNANNNAAPSNIVIFRDGVGDGMFAVVKDHEIPQLQAACEKVGVRSKITFIVVQKRINARFFNLSGRNAENPNPGTVVDTTITRKNLYDFYLVAQQVRQGTVTPCHYVVLQDDSTLGPDIIQRLSYKLCFMYYNWPGTIRVPACCQYAHKLAYMVGGVINRAPAEQLENKLFYL